jgi:hypothetical protein
LALTATADSKPHVADRHSSSVRRSRLRPRNVPGALPEDLQERRGKIAAGRGGNHLHHQRLDGPPSSTPGTAGTGLPNYPREHHQPSGDRRLKDPRLAGQPRSILVVFLRLRAVDTIVGELDEGPTDTAPPG